MEDATFGVGDDLVEGCKYDYNKLDGGAVMRFSVVIRVVYGRGGGQVIDKM